MVGTVNSSILTQFPSSVSQSLTDEQLSIISSTLSELDADNLTEADALSIVETFSEAGIKPGQEMQSAMSALGFDAKEVGDLAAVDKEERPAGPPPREMQRPDEVSEMVSFLEELLEAKLAESEGSELSEQDKEAIYAKVMEQFSIAEGGSIINTAV